MQLQHARRFWRGLAVGGVLLGWTYYPEPRSQWNGDHPTMHNDVTVKIWLTNILIALPIAIVLAVVVNAGFNLPSTGQAWVAMACAVATMIAVHEIRKRKRDEQRRKAKVTAEILLGASRRTTSTWADIPEDSEA